MPVGIYGDSYLVLATNIPDVDEIVRKGKTRHMVEAGGSEVLAVAIDWARQTKDLNVLLPERARLLVLRKHSSEVTANRVAEIFRKRQH